jgi:hypothetical protein
MAYLPLACHASQCVCMHACWRRSGRVIREMAYLPLAEDIPIAFNSCRRGPRGIEWRCDRDAEICWMEAQVPRPASFR